MRDHGKSVAGRFFVLVTATPPGDEARRVGVINSRKFSKKAVERNRARRLLKEAYRLTCSEMQNVWVLLIPRYKIKHVSLNEVLPEFRRLSKKAGILQNSEKNGTVSRK